MVALGVTSPNAKQVRKDYRKLAGSLALTTERGIAIEIIQSERNVKRAYSGRVLQKRTGALWKSVNSFVKRAGFNTGGHIGSSIKYARAHEEGARIKPTGKSAGRRYIKGRKADGTPIYGTSKGRMLAFPSVRAQTGTGTARHGKLDIAISKTVRGPYYTKISRSGKAIIAFVSGSMLPGAGGRKGRAGVRLMGILASAVTLKKGKGRVWAPEFRSIQKRLAKRLPNGNKTEIKRHGFAGALG